MKNSPGTVRVKRFKATIAYEGSGYLGWQSQPGGQTVQDTLETALGKVLGETRVHGASRTDSGVHAWGQVCHFDTSWPHSPQTLQRALQAQLPKSIFIRSLGVVPESFHARYSARGKRYTYRIKLTRADPFEAGTLWEYPYRIDLRQLKRCLKLFVGRHNFASFAGKVHAEETPEKTLTRVSVSKKGAVVTITLVGSGFLYKMARSLVGTSLEVARGKLALERVKALLKTPGRSPEVVTAPAQGLRLEQVIYTPGKQPKGRERGRRDRRKDGDGGRAGR